MEKNKDKYDVNKWSTWAHIIANIEYQVVKNNTGMNKLESLILFSQYLNDAIEYNGKNERTLHKADGRKI